MSMHTELKNIPCVSKNATPLRLLITFVRLKVLISNFSWTQIEHFYTRLQNFIEIDKLWAKCLWNCYLILENFVCMLMELTSYASLQSHNFNTWNSYLSHINITEIQISFYQTTANTFRKLPRSWVTEINCVSRI